MDEGLMQGNALLDSGLMIPDPESAAGAEVAALYWQSSIEIREIIDAFDLTISVPRMGRFVGPARVSGVFCRSCGIAFTCRSRSEAIYSLKRRNELISKYECEKCARDKKSMKEASRSNSGKVPYRQNELTGSMTYSLLAGEVPGPPCSFDARDVARWMIMVMNPDDRDFAFVSSILSYAINHDGLTEKQIRALSAVADRILHAFQCGTLLCQNISECYSRRKGLIARNGGAA